MKYFLDQEFHERMYKPLLGKKHHIIELISIGIVAEDGREYYAVCKDFDLNAAWKNKWLRENVLKRIFDDIEPFYDFNKFNMRAALNEAGKKKEDIVLDILAFTSNKVVKNPDHSVTITVDRGPIFYGYFADYDWVLFCSLFGTMMSLPNGYPMYCIDLMQSLAEKLINYTRHSAEQSGLDVKYCVEICNIPPAERLDWVIKNVPFYPVEVDEHHALSDARWNKALHHFIQML